MASSYISSASCDVWCVRAINKQTESTQETNKEKKTRLFSFNNSGKGYIFIFYRCLEKKEKSDQLTEKQQQQQQQQQPQ